MHIPIIITTPMTPIAFFNIIPQPKTVSTASPNIFPTIGMLLLTIAFAVFAVIPSILLDNVPSKEITPTNVVSITPKIHIIPELNVFDILSICTLSPIFDTILSVAAINTAGIKKLCIIFPIKFIINKMAGSNILLVVMLPVYSINDTNIGTSEFINPTK